MSEGRRAVIVEENSAVPMDIRVWYEATALRDAGWDVTVVCPVGWDGLWYGDGSGPAGAPEHLEGVSIYRFRLDQAQRGALSYLREYASAFLSIAQVCWRIWRKDPFDTIQFCNPPDIFFPIALFYRALGARVIFDHHDLFPELVAEQFPGPLGKAFYALARMAEFLTFRVSHIVMSTNESYRRIAVGRGKIPRDRTAVVRNGPKIGQFVPVDADPAMRRGFRFLACYAGGMGFQDGLMELVAAIRYVVQEAGRHDVLFVLLGDGAARSQTLAALKRWELDQVVDMPGMIRDKALLRCYLSTADVLLSPEPLTPLNTRSTFVKVGEYMAMGKPIVAFDLVETRMTAGEAAVYVRSGDTCAFARAILALLEDPERRELMGEIGRQRILSQFGWEHQEPSLLQAYEMAWTGGRKQRAWRSRRWSNTLPKNQQTRNAGN
jgi:glycosyltransferase involved in cell wall biosynthesis